MNNFNLFYNFCHVIYATKGFSLACDYIEQATFENLDGEYEEIIAMLNSMENKAEKFCF